MEEVKLDLKIDHVTILSRSDDTDIVIIHISNLPPPPMHSKTDLTLEFQCVHGLAEEYVKKYIHPHPLIMDLK